MWAPGTEAQEYPGGWLTPGQYRLTVNVPRVHDKDDGTRSGQARSGDQIVGTVLQRPERSSGWRTHGYAVEADAELENWGTERVITLEAGDTLHVAYGSPVPQQWGKREGSDGMVVHVVDECPQPRGGLWGAGGRAFDERLWEIFRQRVLEAAEAHEPTARSGWDWGPADGTLPMPLNSDFGQMGGQQDNYQGQSLGRWLQNRGFALILEGDASVNREELDRMFQFFTNNVQVWGQWGVGTTAHHHMGHGANSYGPYFVGDSILPALVAAVALDYDLSLIHI